MGDEESSLTFSTSAEGLRGSTRGKVGGMKTH